MIPKKTLLNINKSTKAKSFFAGQLNNSFRSAQFSKQCRKRHQWQWEVPLNENCAALVLGATFLLESSHSRITVPSASWKSSSAITLNALPRKTQALDSSANGTTYSITSASTQESARSSVQSPAAFFLSPRKPISINTWKCIREWNALNAHDVRGSFSRILIWRVILRHTSDKNSDNRALPTCKT